MCHMILRRLALCVVQIFVLSLLVFFLSALMPGDALTGTIDPNMTGERLTEMRQKLGLDKPWGARYLDWLASALRGDFGMSYTHKIPVTRLVGEKIGNTVLLGVFSLFICFAVSIPLGVIAGRNQGLLPDRVISVGSYVLMSTPQAVFGVLSIFLLAYTFAWFPAGGSVSPGAHGFFMTAVSKLHHAALPALTSAAFSIPVLLQLVRAEVAANQNAEYIAILRSRGLSENRIFWVHVLRNSLIPVASLTGALLSAVLSGTVLVEGIFSYPGIGRLFVDSVLKRDYPTANFLILLSALLAVIGTLLSDILMNRLDPRVKMY